MNTVPFRDWDRFESTGSVQDYLIYCENIKENTNEKEPEDRGEDFGNCRDNGYYNSGSQIW